MEFYIQFTEKIIINDFLGAKHYKNFNFIPSLPKFEFPRTRSLDSQLDDHIFQLAEWLHSFLQL